MGDLPDVHARVVHHKGTMEKKSILVLQLFKIYTTRTATYFTGKRD